jgi:hypothetical protein
MRREAKVGMGATAGTTNNNSKNTILQIRKSPDRDLLCRAKLLINPSPSLPKFVEFGEGVTK